MRTRPSRSATGITSWARTSVPSARRMRIRHSWKAGCARVRIDHRLERQQDAPLVERADDLVGRPHVLAAQRVALDVRAIDLERAVALGLGVVERLLRAGEDFRHGAGVARRGDAADRDGDRDRPGGRADHVVAHAGQQALAGLLHVFGRAVVEDHGELVAGEAAEMVAAAHLGAQPLGDRADHLVGDVEAVGLVEAGEIVDRDQQQAAGAALIDRLLQRRLQHLGEMPAVHLAGQAVEVRQVGELLLLRVPLVDDMDDAVRARRLAVVAGEPAAGVLDPELGLRAFRRDRILHLIGHAGALVALRRIHHRVVAGLRGRRRRAPGVAAPGRDRGAVARA